MTRDTQSLVEGFVKPSRGRGVKRDESAYSQALETSTIELQRLLEIYRTTVFVEDNRARFYRDAIDHWVRRYHDYAISGKIKSHYREVGVDEKNCVFEHVLPTSSAVDMLIQDRLTIDEALNTPTCLIKKSSDLVLKNNGLTKSSLLKKIWNHNSDLESHAFETHLHRLRKKIKKYFNDKKFIIENNSHYYLSK